ncbi:YchJ family protein [Puerhibacterium puerhi]|uniref:YchJ family protein n=1 Tax=Puerhibacterium puerhi TaxID=2692623 RepID=UPI001F173BC8|nr:YchJ family protein [Puerhibacterium puerhi]
MALTIADSDRCPCLSGDTYGACCGPIHRGERLAPTAEALMRSRYSAFAVGDAAWLLASWHPRTRPATVDLDDDVAWRRLDVLATRGGGPFDDQGEVEFAAFWRDGASGERGRLHEVSRFVREPAGPGGRWLYVDGDTQP